ncbi:hypothetical protein GWK47_022572 [Chionoecetes opilio]|uniref:Uncharacterized protein n=1 Tax=Chionoecetes opilio TaxID=41210 RepID=A0A8J4XN42_CHIOP|nr:hypothetical protein GWK47_022572 [Chionoecetes opilio]
MVPGCLQVYWGLAACRVIGVSWETAVVVVPAFRDGRCNCSTFTLSHRSVVFLGTRTEPLLGKQLPKNGQVLRRFFHFVRVQRKSVKEAASLVTAEVAVVWEKARIPTQKKSRCVERILRLYASWQNLDRSKKRSAESKTNQQLN